MVQVGVVKPAGTAGKEERKLQKVNVKSVSRKEGTGEKGPWTNTSVTGEDGAVFGTFSKSALEIAAGDLIELDPVVKGKYINFSDWNMLEKGTGSVPAASTSASPNGGGFKRDIDGIRFKYQCKAQIVKGERASIEAQTAFKGIIELAPQLGQYPELVEVFQEAIAWARSKMAASLANPAPSEAAGATPAPSTADAPVETPVSLPYVEPDEPFAHIGALLAWCKNYGIDRPTFIQIAKCDENAIKGLDVEKTFALVKAYIIERAGAQAEAKIFGKEK